MKVSKPFKQQKMLVGRVLPDKIKVDVSDSMKRRLQNGADPTSLSHSWQAKQFNPPPKKR